MFPNAEMSGPSADLSPSPAPTASNRTVFSQMLEVNPNVDDEASQPPSPDGTGLPGNFHIVGPGIYRSSHPQPAHLEKLRQLKLRTVITFLPEGTMPLIVSNWMAFTGVEHHHAPILANKDPTAPRTPYSTIESVLTRLLSATCTHPVLIHCNKGKHRTGCVTACFRKVTGWSTASALAEYEKHSTPKDRELDRVFIANFEPSAAIKGLALENGFVGGAWAQPKLMADSMDGVRSTDAHVVSLDESEMTMGTAPWGSSREGSI